MAGVFDYFFWCLGILLGIAGFALLYWSLFHDRARGRRRCPKCWYDMAGTPGLRCSECGFEARREKRLFRTRRRWRVAAIAFFALLAVPFIARFNSIRRDGLYGFIPTTVMAFIVANSSDADLASGWRAEMLDQLLINRLDVTQRLPQAPPELWDWQWQWLIKHSLTRLHNSKHSEQAWMQILEQSLRCGSAQRNDLANGILASYLYLPICKVETPQQWPRDLPMPVKAHVESGSLRDLELQITPTSSSAGGLLYWDQKAKAPHAIAGWDDEVEGLLTVPGLDDGELSIDFDVKTNIAFLDRAGKLVRQPLRTTTVRKTVWITGALNQFIRPLRESDLDQIVCQGFECHFVRPSTIQLSLGGPIAELQRVGTKARLQLVHDDAILFDQTESFGVGDPLTSHPVDHRIHAMFGLTRIAELGEILMGEKPSGNWQLRFSIDPAQMLYDDDDRRGTYWPGEIILPIEWETFRSGVPVRCTQQ